MAIGTRLDGAGCTKASRGHRLSKAEGLAYSQYATFKRPGHTANTLAAWRATVAACALHDAGSWSSRASGQAADVGVGTAAKKPSHSHGKPHAKTSYSSRRKGLTKRGLCINHRT